MNEIFKARDEQIMKRDIVDARLEDFNELMRLLNRCYPLDVMEKDYCHTYRPNDANYTAMNKIIKDGNRIIANIGISPLDVIVEDVELKVAGIGGVAVDPEYRGKGLMRDLLKFSIQHMKEAKYDISVLGGDRWRYGNYGWENGGRCYSFSINKSSVKHLKPDRSKIEEFSEDKIREIIKMHDGEVMRVSREEEDYRLMFKRANRKTFLAVRDGDVVAYLTLTVGKAVVEFGGDYRGLSDLLLFCINDLGIQELTVESPFTINENTKLLFKASTSWVIKTPCMVKIINLRSLMSKCLPLINKRYRLSGDKINQKLVLKSSDSGESVTLIYGENVELSDEAVSNRLELSDRELTRLIFGITKPSMVLDLGEYGPLPDRIFPLDFYIWCSEFI